MGERPMGGPLRGTAATRTEGVPGPADRAHPAGRRTLAGESLRAAARAPGAESRQAERRARAAERVPAARPRRVEVMPRAAQALAKTRPAIVTATAATRLGATE